MSTPSATPPQRTNQGWPFEVLDQIGEGGMGVVYRARYTLNGRHVALKMVPADVTDKTVLARFERELEVLKNLRHPNIVRCFGGASENNRRYYAMELVEGGNLEEKLHVKGRLPWEQVIYYGMQMCEALECSHSHGVVHRDLKPSNFLLTPSGQIKLSDFGLASVTAARKITAAGKTAGTFLYMAPEQIRGHEVTPQTDLYALGCVLFELLTGATPFETDTPAATLHKHCHEAPPRVLDRVLDCPVELEQIIHKLLEKRAEDRYESAAVVHRELKAVPQKVLLAKKRAEAGSWVLKNDPPAKAAQPPVVEANPPSLPIAARQKITAERRWIEWFLGGMLVLSLALNVMPDLREQSGGQWQEHWVAAAQHENMFVRLAAIETMSELAGESDQACATLATALTDADPMIRLKATQGLMAGGGRSKEYLPVMIRLQNQDSDASVRDAAVSAVSVVQQAPPVNGGRSLVWIALAVVAVAGAIAFFWQRGRAASRKKPAPGFLG
ncbi:MAG: protein kinase [Planctomycetaceae bacterium]|nr:protein kinase [Planctomycetaceae bacterium]